jgi:hypothetical protein
MQKALLTCYFENTIVHSLICTSFPELNLISIMSSNNDNNRRGFIKKFTGGALLTAASGPLFAGERIFSRELPWEKPRFAANDNIQIACIGTGIMGMGDTRTALKVPGVKLMAVADLYDGHLVRAKELFGDDIQTTRDYNETTTRYSAARTSMRSSSPRPTTCIRRSVSRL